MASKVKDFLDLVKEIRGTTFNEDGSPKTGLWAEIKAWHTAIGLDKTTITNQIAAAESSLAVKVGFAEEWAKLSEDTLISTAAGGSGNEYSSYHYSRKSNASAIAAAAEAASAMSSAQLAENSMTSANNTAVSVAGSAAAAASSAVSAGNSATTASTKAIEATGSRNVSWDWANKAEDLSVDDGTHPVSYSSYHWARKAAAAVSALNGITTFTQLTDTPASYAGATGQYLRVGPTNNIEFDILDKNDVGLSLVDNTSDASKPVSTATQTALDLKANLNSPVFSGNVTGLGTSTGTSFNAITGLASVAPIAPAATAALGVSTKAAREDHAHPTNFTTTATDIKMDGVQAVGVLTTFSRADHVHPSDTTKANLASTVLITGNQTIAGIKTFSDNILGFSGTSAAIQVNGQDALIINKGGSTSKVQSITCTQGSGALTFGLNPCVLDFRSTTLTTGVPATRTVNTALSLVLPSGGTLGSVTTVSARLILLAIDNAGTVELAVVNQSGGNDLSESGVINTTAIDTGSDSANVIYSTTARTGVAYRVVGAIDVVNTAGAWGNPTLVQGAGGNALTAMSSLGYGQTWQSVTRTSGTTYYNTTGKPIEVNAWVASTTSASISLTINGILASSAGYNGTSGTPLVTGVVPLNAYYVITVVNPTGYAAAELR